MLVLTRKHQQSLWIGDTEVKVLGTDSRGGIRLGIKAPKDIPVHRDEIQKQLPEVVSFANPSKGK